MKSRITADENHPQGFFWCSRKGGGLVPSILSPLVSEETCIIHGLGMFHKSEYIYLILAQIQHNRS